MYVFCVRIYIDIYSRIYIHTRTHCPIIWPIVKEIRKKIRWHIAGVELFNCSKVKMAPSFHLLLPAGRPAYSTTSAATYSGPCCCRLNRS